ncbi:MAG TPA: ABC transporter substrate-binding protein [Steroidobacteraceae bacterium]|nr:ABC transporter substrate-binding protein [Steroidobacteraceae bacterium]
MKSKSPNSIAKAVLLAAFGAACGAVHAGRAATPGPAPAATPAVAQMGPEQVVENSAKRMLTELSAHRAMYAKDPAKLDALVANVLLPNFDSEYAARLVLGPAWRTATPEQRKRFVAAFYHSLLHSYGAALVDFTANRFHILPYRGRAGATQATVRTFVMRANGERVPVDFTLHKTPGGWKAWDVVIEGISYVKSFRTDFASEIQQKGLAEVITRLERENGGSSTGPAGPKPRSNAG